MNIFEGARRVTKVVAAMIVVGFVFALATERRQPVSVSYLLDSDKPPIRIDDCGSVTPDHSKLVLSASGHEAEVHFCYPSLTATQSQEKPLTKEFSVKGPDGTIKKVTAPADSTADQVLAIFGAKILIDPDYVSANDATQKAIRVKYGIHGEGPKWQVETFDPDEYLRNVKQREELALLRSKAREYYDAFKIPSPDEGYIVRAAWLQVAKSTGMYFLGMISWLVALWCFTWVVGWVVRGFMGIPRGADHKEQT